MTAFVYVVTVTFSAINPAEEWGNGWEVVGVYASHSLAEEAISVKENDLEGFGVDLSEYDVTFDIIRKRLRE